MADTQPTSSRIESSPLYNPDLAPAGPERRHWGTYNFAALWVSMSVNILTYMLAASLIQGGMDWKQAVGTVFLGNIIVLVPMLLNSHPGARYGIPFPVLARASFGVLGANIAAVLRALVACGWFGIQTWIGGEAVSTLIATLAPSWKNFEYGAAVCFLAFWLINLAVILKGIESEAAAKSLYSTVHGAGCVMSRTEAKGKRNRKTGEVIREGRVSQEAMQAWLRQKGVHLVGGDLDEAPQAYRRLTDVLSHHEGTVEIEHRLRPFIVLMAGADVFDPFKD